MALLSLSPHQAARRLHQRILQATDTANTKPPAPLPVLSATPTPPLPTLDLPTSAAMTSAESSTSTHGTPFTSASSQHHQREDREEDHKDGDVDMQGQAQAQVPASQPPSLYEAVFGSQIALQLHNAAAIAQPKTPPATSQRSFQLGTPAAALTPRTPRSAAAMGLSARLHRLSSTPQLGSPERARRGGPPVGIDPHNSPTPQHLQREDELAFSHPHQSYVILSPSKRKAGVIRKATSSPALSPSKRQRRAAPAGEDDSIIGMLASMAEERTRSRAATPTRTPTRSRGTSAAAAADEHTFADPRSITPRKARVMMSMMPPNGADTGASGQAPVTPPSRPIALPAGDGVGTARPLDDDKEANLLLYLANSPTVRQPQQSTPRSHGHPATPTRSVASSSTPGQQYYTPSLLDTLERRNSRHRASSANGIGTPLIRTPQSHHRRTGSRDFHGGRVGRTLFEEDEDASEDSPLPGSIDGLLAPPPALTPSGKQRPVLGASSSPLTPPYSDHLKHTATMSGSNLPEQQRDRSVTTSASLETPPATPAKQRGASAASRLGVTQTPQEIAAAWDTSSDEEAASGDDTSGHNTLRRGSMSMRARRASAALRMTTPDGLPTTPGGKQRAPRSRAPTADGEAGQVPRTPSPAPTVSSEPRTPHTPNTAAFAYSEYLNVSPSPNPGRSRVSSANGRFPSCNGHIVPLEDAMTWDDAMRANGSASARRGGHRTTTTHNVHSTPTRQRQHSSTGATTGTMLTPGPILYYPSSPTFTVRGESSRRLLRAEEQQEQREPDGRRQQGRDTRSPRSESRDSVALPLDAGFKEGFGREASGAQSQSQPKPQRQRTVSPAAATSPSPALNVGLGLSY